MTSGVACMDKPETAGQLALTLPLPPSVNHLYATVQGRRVLSRDGRTFKACVAEAVENWLEEHPAFDVSLLAQHYLALTLLFYFATALRRDLDGGLKIAQDALCEALGVNDNLVLEIYLSKRVDRHHPRMEVLLTTLTGEQVHLGAASQGSAVPALAAHPAKRPKRRRRRKQRGLEELAARHRWELEPMAND